MRYENQNLFISRRESQNRREPLRGTTGIGRTT